MLALLLSLVGLSAAADPAITQASLVVERVEPKSPAEDAGFALGDVLVAWNTPSTAGSSFARRLLHPSDLDWIEAEQHRLGPLSLLVRRGAEELSLSPRLALSWGLDVRPALDEGLLRVQREASQLVAQSRSKEAAQLLQAVASRAAGDVRSFLLLQALRTLVQDKQLEQALKLRDETLATERDWWLWLRWARLITPLDSKAGAEAYVRAFEERRTSGLEDAFDVSMHRALARAAAGHDDVLRRATLRAGLELAHRLVPDSLLEAALEHDVGFALLQAMEPSAARPHAERALALRQRLEPGALDEARSHNILASVLVSLGDLDAAELSYNRSLELAERVEPTGIDYLRALANVCLLRWDQSRLREADETCGRVIELQRIRGRDIELLRSLSNWGLVARDRGDLLRAEAILEEAMALAEEIAPDSRQMAFTLGNAASVAIEQGQGDRAEALLRRSIAILESVAPAAQRENWTTLAALARSRGDWHEVRTAEERALALGEIHAPESRDLVPTLTNLAGAWRHEGAPERARPLLERALGLARVAAPRGRDAAAVLRATGELAADAGDDATALRHLEDAAAMLEGLGSSNLARAETLHALGRVRLRLGQRQTALQALLEALDVLDDQLLLFGATLETRMDFRSRHRQLYLDAVDALLAAGRENDALLVVERVQARGFLEWLARRQTRVPGAAEASEPYERERRKLARDYESLQAALAGVADPASAERRRLDADLLALRRRQEKLREDWRRASPGAAWQLPQRPVFADLEQALEPGTAALVYLVEPQRTLLFSLERDLRGTRLSVDVLPIGEDGLRERIEAFGSLCRRPGQGGREQLLDAGRELYERLVRPAEARLRRAKRVLFVPDGPLHALPFAALVRGPDYLVSWRPLYVAPSLSAHARLRALPQQGGPERFAAVFGNPTLPAVVTGPSTAAVATAGSVEPLLRSAVSRGWTYQPLPGSRREAERVALHLGARTQLYLGSEATEARAKSSAAASILHFAAHGLLDKNSPLDSALLLAPSTTPGAGHAENGVLYAWEVLEEMPLAAELVTLSACDTAVGKELSGEGWIGLVRAFHAAGARSVLGALWPVADDSTAELMDRFYAELRRGRPKAEALRAAQRDQIRRGRLPFHWAAFQLSGDGR